MIRASLISLLCLLLVPTPASARPAGPPVVIKKTQIRDLAAIRSSRVLHVLVNQSRNSSGEVQGEYVGVEYRRLQAFEKYLNGHARDGQKVSIKLIPKAKDQLLAALQRGEGDLVAPGELLDASAARYVDATQPVVSHVPLVVVGVRGERSFKHPEQLSGRTLMLASGSAADEAIAQLNQKLALRKLPPVKIEWVDPSLAVEDVLEMVEAGIYHLTVVEQPIAERWARVMPKLRVDRSVTLSDPADMNWYVRKDAVMLRATVDRFLETTSRQRIRTLRFRKPIRTFTAFITRWPARTASVWKNCDRPCNVTRMPRRWTGLTSQRWPSRSQRSTRWRRAAVVRRGCCRLPRRRRSGWASTTSVMSMAMCRPRASTWR